MRPAHSWRVHVVIFNLMLRAIANEYAEGKPLCGLSFPLAFVAKSGELRA
jgi:hypothetical protein